MSWKTINQILGLAAADPEFWQQLQDNPLDTIQHYGLVLTKKESEVISKANRANLTLFSQNLLAQLDIPEEEKVREMYDQE